MGSHARYSSCRNYLGPKSNLAFLVDGQKEAPHSRRFTEQDGKLEGCAQYEWIPETTLGKPYAWASRSEADRCLAGRWIAIWGDSTSRILFSALVDFLANGIEDLTFPTHDFSYDAHAEFNDKCNEEEEQRTGVRCHLAAVVPRIGAVLTFNFVTRMDMWPSLKESLATYSDKGQFPQLPLSPASVPDLLLVNSGPWETYQFATWPGWKGGDMYRNAFFDFFRKEWAPLAAAGGGRRPKLFLLGNTACPEGHKCKTTAPSTAPIRDGRRPGSAMPCHDAMKAMKKMQVDMLAELAPEFEAAGNEIRYFDAVPLWTPLPDGYHCFASGFHLPGVVTDSRASQVLYAACSGAQ